MFHSCGEMNIRQTPFLKTARELFSSEGPGPGRDGQVRQAVSHRGMHAVAASLDLKTPPRRESWCSVGRAADFMARA